MQPRTPLIVVLLAATSFASPDGAGVDLIAKTRTAWSEVVRTKKACHDATIALAAAKPEEAEPLKSARRSAYDAALGSLWRFYDAFGACDPEKLDAAGDSALLTSGTTGVAERLLSARDASNATKANQMLSRLMERVASAKRDVDARFALVDSLWCEGDVARAVDQARRALGEVPDGVNARLRMLLAEASWCAGDVEGAKRAYQEIADRSARDAENRPQSEDEHESQERFAPLVAKMESSYVGTVPHELRPKSWIGGAPQSFAACRGKVVIMHSAPMVLSAEWNAWRTVEDLRKRREAGGLVVFGTVARPAAGRARLPNPGARTRNDATDVDVSTDEAFGEFVGRFRDNLGLGFPIAITSPRGLPLTTIVGRDGVVAFPGEPPPAALAALVDRLLAAPPPK